LAVLTLVVPRTALVFVPVVDFLVDPTLVVALTPAFATAPVLLDADELAIGTVPVLLDTNELAIGADVLFIALELLADVIGFLTLLPVTDAIGFLTLLPVATFFAVFATAALVLVA
jgi:hypothetical protein